MLATANYFSRIAAWCLAAAAICGLVAGCGQGNRATATGHVTLDGEPLADGVISFRPTGETHGPEFSAKVAQGEYQLGAPQLSGEYTVEIQAWRKTGRKIKGQFDQEVEESVQAIPDRYRGPQTELSTRLNPGPNTRDFDLDP